MGSKTRQCISRNWGPVLVLLSQILSGVMNLCVKLLETKSSNPISPFSILKIRMIITLTLSAVYCWMKDVDDFPLGPREVRWLMLLRAAGGCCGAIGFYFSLEYLPLAEASVLNLLAPLGCCIASALLMRGGVSTVQVVAAFMSAAAVLITVQPKFITQHLGLGDKGVVDYAGAGSRNMLTGIAFALFGAFGGAIELTNLSPTKCAYTCVRLMGTRAHPLISVNYFAFTMIAVTSAAILLEPRPSILKLDLLQGALLVAVGLVGFLVEFVLTSGLAIERSSSSTLFIFSQVLFAGFLDWIFWAHIPKPTAVIGGLMLILSLTAILMDKSTETPPKVAEGASRLGIYDWLQKKMGKKTIRGADLKSISLESLLSSNDGTNIDED
ncbi:hypothetical protein KVR01_001911 [Diaporthe batatas]|uniref:uncharacterized protein n=1 Tax=Diaporthe batatas TaxID=748121 RepID=UPI001D03D0C7|nr:uncharacterized protein KVR01_001911 [Diaporthe batatas]KAG8169162.1 hypothetical protein KVR01_001911 [Diaporthe batatas]